MNYVSAISRQNTLSFRIVAQVQYANDATWPGFGSNNVLFGTRGADNNNRIFLYFDANGNRFKVYLNGATRLTPDILSFSAGERFDIVLTLDFSNDRCRMYINGELVATNTNTLSAPTLTTWRLGSSYAGTAQAGVIVAEYMFIDKVLTEQEVTALYALHRPLTDAAALFHPPAPGAYKYDVSNSRVYYMTPSGPKYASLT